MSATSTDDAHALYVQGRERIEANDLERAVVLLEKSAALYPHFKTLELLGECYMLMGKHTQAVIPLAAATSLNEQPRAPALLSQVLLRLGENDDAARIARLALLRGPGNKAALEVLKKLEGGAESAG